MSAVLPFAVGVLMGAYAWALVQAVFDRKAYPPGSPDDALDMLEGTIELPERTASGSELDAARRAGSFILRNEEGAEL